MKTSCFNVLGQRVLLVIALISVVSCSKKTTYDDLSDPSTREVYKIWSDAEYNAYSDLIRYNGAFYCAFREGSAVLGSGGTVRIIKSTDGVNWESVQSLNLEPDVAPPPTELEFNGADQYMTIPHHTDFDFTADGVFSLTTWVYRGNTGLSDLVSTWNGGNGYFLGASATTFLLDLASTGAANSTTRIHNRTASANPPGTWFLNPNAWYHLGFVFDGPNKKVWLYQNGQNLALNTGQTNDIQQKLGLYPANTYGNDITIFAKTRDKVNPNAATSRYWKGALRTMRFWNKVLSPAEMEADLNAMVTAETPNLIAAYDFSQVTKQGTQHIVPDIKGNHPGILHNFLIPEAEILLPDVMTPKLTITPDNRLMLLVDGEMYNRGSLVSRRPYVSYSNTNGENFSALERSDIYYPDTEPSEDNFWIWNMTWDNNKTAAYGFDHTNGMTLMRTTDGGESFHAYHTLSMEVASGKATIRFGQQNNIYALIAKETGDRKAVLAISAPPYQDFSYYTVDEQLEVPSFVFLNDNTICIAAKAYTSNTTQLLVIDLEGNILRRMPLPSAGENSYPGAVVHDGYLWVSYHTSNSGNPDIYMAKVPVDYLLRSLN